MNYFYGMLYGLIVVGLEAVVIGVILKGFNVAQTTFFGIVGSIIVGGIGSIVSVLSRMSTGYIDLDPDADSTEITRIGVFRPIIGSIMGVIIYSLMLSSILPVEIPQDPETQMYFFVIVAFLAGFTERWAQDMLDLARGRISDKAREDAERKKFEEETRQKLEAEVSEKLEAERKKFEEETR